MCSLYIKMSLYKVIIPLSSKFNCNYNPIKFFGTNLIKRSTFLPVSVYILKVLWIFFHFAAQLSPHHVKACFQAVMIGMI